VSFELSFFSSLIDVCSTANHVVCLTYCVLDSDGPVLLLRDRELASSGSCLVGYGVSLVDRG